MTSFLIVFDRVEGRVRHINSYENEAEASVQYEIVERRFLLDENIEVVLLGADSVETLHGTHANYFGDGRGQTAPLPSPI